VFDAFTYKVCFELCGGILASIVRPQELYLSPLLILHHSILLLKLLKYLQFLFQEVHPNSLGEVIYECDIVSCTSNDATGKDPHISVCMRSGKPSVLCYDVEKATQYCLPIM